MRKLTLVTAVMIVSILAISVYPQSAGPTARDEVLLIAQNLCTSELDLFLTKGHKYVPLEQAARNVESKGSKMPHIAVLDSVSGVAGEYIISVVVSPDQEHFKLSVTPKAQDCNWSVFSDEHGVIYFGQPINCIDKSLQ